MRPNSIRWFEKLFIISIVADLLATLLFYAAVRDQTMAQGGSVEEIIIEQVFILLIGWLFWLLIARRASNVTKWVLVTLSVASLLLLPEEWNNAVAIGTGYSALTALAIVVGYAAPIFLFNREAVAWLKSGGLVEPVDPEVFS